MFQGCVCDALGMLLFMFQLCIGAAMAISSASLHGRVWPHALLQLYSAEHTQTVATDNRQRHRQTPTLTQMIRPALKGNGDLRKIPRVSIPAVFFKKRR